MPTKNPTLATNPHYQHTYEKTMKGGSEPGGDAFKSSSHVRADKAGYKDAKADLAMAKLSKIHREATEG